MPTGSFFRVHRRDKPFRRWSASRIPRNRPHRSITNWTVPGYIFGIGLPLIGLITLIILLFKRNISRWNIIYVHAEEYGKIYYLKVGIPLMLIGIAPYVYNLVKSLA